MIFVLLHQWKGLGTFDGSVFYTFHYSESQQKWLIIVKGKSIKKVYPYKEFH